MSDTRLPPGFKFDQPDHRLPPGFTFDTPPTDPNVGTAATKDPETTAGGLAGAATRGLAPVATGAAIGAAAGAPLAGVGAIPGAAVGAGAVGLTELATSVYNPLAERFGWPKSATPQEMTDRVLDVFGIKRPQTPSERLTEAATGGAARAIGPAGAAGQIAEKAVSPVIKGIASKLAEKPLAQGISGALSGVGAQEAAELGAGPVGQMIGSTLGAAAGRRAERIPEDAAVKARLAGYVLPPAMINEKPGLVSNVLSGFSGKIKTAQAASEKNQIVTNELAAKDLGLPPGTPLNEQAFEYVRQRAGLAYPDVINAVPIIRTDEEWLNTVSSLGSRNSQAAKEFPKIMANTGIQDLVDELKGKTQFTTESGIELVKELRFSGNSNLKAIGDPAKHALGLAQREAADAVDNLMDRNISAAGQPDTIAAYREARQMIAKSYDVEGATNIANGDVNARGLARLAARGRPLTGGLDTIADAGAAFPRAMNPPSAFGQTEALSALDFFGAAASPGHVGAMMFARPLARATVLAEPYQRAIARPRAVTNPSMLPLLMQPGLMAAQQPSGLEYGESGRQ